MAAKASEHSTPAALTHLIEFTALGADGAETIGVATVTGTTDTIPWSELAAIPGFRCGDVLRANDNDPRPQLLGPGTDTPGHPAWCRLHDAAQGDGTSVCLGRTLEVDCDQDNPARGVVGAGLSVATDAAPTIDLTENGVGGVSLTLAAAREYALLLLDLVAQAEAGTAVTA